MDKLGSKTADFFDPSSSYYQQRVSLMVSALEDSLRYLARGGEIVIIDGTNTTRDRRQLIRDRLAKENNYEILWIESVYTTDDVISDEMVEQMKNSPDFLDKDDYTKRLALYKQNYDSLEQHEGSYVKVYSLISSMLIITIIF